MLPLRKKGWSVRWAVGFILLCQLQALSIFDRILYGQWMGKSGDKLTQTINLMQIIIGVALFLKGSRHWQTIKTGGLLSIVLAIFVLASAAWSVSSEATVRSGVQYLVFIITAIGVSGTLDGDDFMDLLAKVCFLSAIASMILLIVSPESVIGEFAGDFRGVFPQKNPLGQAMAMGALASLHGILTSRRRRFFRIVMLTTVTLVTARASSATSLLTIALFILLGLTTKIMEKRGSAASILIGCTLVLAVPVALMSLFDGGALLGMMGKDATLTGRTDIWEYVIPDIYQRPLLGWGYAAFWTADNPAAWKISDILRWWVPQAHNGVLEILLSVGFVGLVFYVFLLGRTWSLSLKCMRTADRQMGVTCFLLCIGIVVVGVSENVLIYTGGISFLFFTTGFYCERAVSMSAQRARWSNVSGPVGVEAARRAYRGGLVRARRLGREWAVTDFK
jgi:exopolysaccharide production protein ExoQ